MTEDFTLLPMTATGVGGEEDYVRDFILRRWTSRWGVRGDGSCGGCCGGRLKGLIYILEEERMCCIEDLGR